MRNENGNNHIITMKTYEQSALASTAIRKSAFARSMSSKRDLFTWWQSFQQQKRHDTKQNNTSALYCWKFIFHGLIKPKIKENRRSSLTVNKNKDMTQTKEWLDTFLADQMLRARARQPAARRRGINQLEREEAIFVFCLKIEEIYLIAWIKSCSKIKKRLWFFQTFHTHEK